MKNVINVPSIRQRKPECYRTRDGTSDFFKNLTRIESFSTNGLPPPNPVVVVAGPVPAIHRGRSLAAEWTLGTVPEGDGEAPDGIVNPLKSCPFWVGLWHTDASGGRLLDQFQSP